MAHKAAHEQVVVVLEQNIEAMENMTQFAAMADNTGDDEDEFQCIAAKKEKQHVVMGIACARQKRELEALVGSTRCDGYIKHAWKAMVYA